MCCHVSVLDVVSDATVTTTRYALAGLLALVAATGALYAFGLPPFTDGAWITVEPADEPTHEPIELTDDFLEEYDAFGAAIRELRAGDEPSVSYRKSRATDPDVVTAIVSRSATDTTGPGLYVEYDGDVYRVSTDAS